MMGRTYRVARVAMIAGSGSHPHLRRLWFGFLLGVACSVVFLAAGGLWR